MHAAAAPLVALSIHAGVTSAQVVPGLPKAVVPSSSAAAASSNAGPMGPPNWSERLAEVRAAHERLLADPRQPGEPLGVDLARVQSQPVPRAVGEQDCGGSGPVRLERVAQAQDEGLQRLGGAGRGLVVPQRVDQLARGDQPPRGRDQPGEEQALLASPDLDGALDVLDTQRTQDGDVHAHTVEELLHDGYAFRRAIERPPS
jgi:hypothetical protein